MGQNKINKMIAIASGKGGVGKSTVAVSLAVSLAKSGARVGLLDADIYGPSQPTMLGVGARQPEVKQGKLQPIEKYGVLSMSVGYLAKPDDAIVWRGPMLGKVLQQLMQDTEWGELDFLVIDLPPGTGDVQLTLCQKMNIIGAVIVTTPQDVALNDVRRACAMFNKLNVPILGVVENMSVFHCPNCQHPSHLFGQGGGRALAEKLNLKLLESLPLSQDVCEYSDRGDIAALLEKNDIMEQAYKNIANGVKEQLSLQKKDYSKLFPKVVVEDKS